MLSPHAIQRYVLLLVAIMLGAIIVFLVKAQKDPPYEEVAVAILLGWVVGQLFPWSPPR